MDRHPIDIPSLVMGLALLATAVVVLVVELSGADVHLRALLPAVLVTVGAAGLSGSLLRRMDR